MKENEEYEIDLLQILKNIRKNIVLFICICVVCAGIGYAITTYLLEEEFTSSSDIIVVQNKDDTSSGDVTYTDLQLSQKLANTYSQILTSDIIVDRVIDELHLASKYKIDSTALKKMITVQNVNSTEIIRVFVKTNDPKLSADITNKLISVFQEEIYAILKVNNISVLNTAKVPTQKSGPSVIKNMAIAGAIGIVICCLIALIQTLKDTKIKTEEEIRSVLPYPIIGSIPEIIVTESEKKSL